MPCSQTIRILSNCKIVWGEVDNDLDIQTDKITYYYSGKQDFGDDFRLAIFKVISKVLFRGSKVISKVLFSGTVVGEQ
jgi:hypothetical protein